MTRPTAASPAPALMAPVPAGGVGSWLAPQPGTQQAARLALVTGGGKAAAAAAAPAGAAGRAPAASVAGMQVIVRLADGSERSVPVQTAVAMGVVRLGLGGHPVVTELGRKSLARIVPSPLGAPAVAAVEAGPQRRAGVLGRMMKGLSLGGEHHGATVARQGTTALLPMPHAKQTLGAEGENAEPSGSETLSKAASAAFLIRGGLKLAQGPGYPTWMTLYYFFNGMDRFTDGKFQPAWLQKGPLKDLMQFSILGLFLKSTVKPLPEAFRQFNANKAALQAASGASKLGFGGMLKAALKPLPAKDAVEGAAKAAGEATKGNAELPFISKMFPAIAPLYKLGYTLSGVSSLLALPEYMEKHGTSGMVTTKSGRAAAMGAVGGALLLGSIYMPPSPAQLVVDFGSIAMWALEVANGKGWLDPMLGGDPPAPTEPAPVEAGNSGSSSTDEATGEGEDAGTSSKKK